jgi:hypothetical protein
MSLYVSGVFGVWDAMRFDCTGASVVAKPISWAFGGGVQCRDRPHGRASEWDRQVLKAGPDDHIHLHSRGLDLPSPSRQAGAESGVAECETAGGCSAKIVKQGATRTIPFAAPRPGLVLRFGLRSIVRRLLIRVQLRIMDLLSHVVQAIRRRFATGSCRPYSYSWPPLMPFPPPFGIFMIPIML